MRNSNGITSKGWFIVLLLIFFFPLGLYFMWKNEVFSKKARVIVTIIVAVVVVVSLINGDGSNYSPTDEAKTGVDVQKNDVEDSQEDKKGSNDDKEKQKVETDNKDDNISEFKKEFLSLIDSYDASVMDDWDLVKSNNGETNLVAGVLIKNDEQVINDFLEELNNLIKDSVECDGALITFGDKTKGPDGEMLLLASIINGEITTTMQGSSYNSETNDTEQYNTSREQWINSQFSIWDGSHKEMTKLIKQNLNDEKSYKHIETNYKDISSSEVADEVNGLLSEAGVEDRVSEGDLLIITEFSAKNAFNATVKNTAYGIASYEDNTIKLIAIE